jgi:hypothetical protein
VVPKFHGAKLTDIPDDNLSEILVRQFFPNVPTELPGKKSGAVVL